MFEPFPKKTDYLVDKAPALATADSVAATSPAGIVPVKQGKTRLVYMMPGESLDAYNNVAFLVSKE
jgi:hypothetical protein